MNRVEGSIRFSLSEDSSTCRRFWVEPNVARLVSTPTHPVHARPLRHRQTQKSAQPPILSLNPPNYSFARGSKQRCSSVRSVSLRGGVREGHPDSATTIHMEAFPMAKYCRNECQILKARLEATDRTPEAVLLSEHSEQETTGYDAPSSRSPCLRPVQLGPQTPTFESFVSRR